MKLYLFEVRYRACRNVKKQIMPDHNKDYAAHFTFDEEWNGKTKTARFQMGNEQVEMVLDNDACLIPHEIVKQGFIKVGVYCDEYATSPCEVHFGESILTNEGQEPAPPEDFYRQILKLIEDGKTVGPKGEDGEDYVITEADKKEIEDNLLKEVDTDLTEQIEDAKKTIESDANKSIDALNKVVESGKQSVTEEVKKGNEAIVETVEGVVAKVEKVGAENVSAVNTAGSSNVSEINRIGQSNVNAVNSAKESAVTSINQTGAKNVSDVNNAGSTNLRNIITKGAEAVQNVQNEGNAQVGNVTKAAGDIVGKIEQIQRNTEDIAHLSQTIVNKGSQILETASGKYITVKDSDDAEIPVLEIYGNSTQEQYTGSNILNILPSETKHATKKYDLDNGLIVMNGAGGFTIPITPIVLKAKKNYYCKMVIECGTASQSDNNLINVAEKWLKNNEFITISFNNDTRVESLWAHINATFNNAIIKIWIGETMSDYEPYCGGKPSPSLEYPQPIVSVGDSGELSIESCGKNLISLKKLDYDNKRINVVEIENGIQITSKISTWYSLEKVFRLILKPNRKVYFSCIGDVLTPNGETRVAIVDSTGNRLYYSPENNIKSNNIIEFNCMTPNDGVVDLFFRCNYEGSSQKVQYTNIQLTYEETDVYEPYKSSDLTISLTLPLRGIPIPRNDNVNINGKEYVADVLKMFFDGSGEIANYTDEYICTGNENWMLNSSKTFRANVRDKTQTPRENCFNNYFPYKGWDKMESAWVNDTQPNVLQVCVNTENFNSVEEFKTWLKELYANGNPMKFTFISGEVRRKKLTPEQVQGVLKTYLGTTHIFNSENADMKVEYACNPKMYIDNKFESVNNQLTQVIDLLSPTATSAMLLENLEEDLMEELK